MVLAILLVIAVIVVFFIWAVSGTSNSDPIFDGPVIVRGRQPGAGKPSEQGLAGAQLKIITFNIAYGRGVKDDLGDLRDKPTIVGNLNRIAEVIRQSGADIAALQEVDIDSSRTHRIDQMRYLARKLNWHHMALAMTWENNYVPYPYWPPSQHYGRMRSGQCVISRLPLRSNRRYRFSQPKANPFYFNWFYLHRAAQRVDVDLGRGRVVRLFNTHLEAFDEANRTDQARKLSGILKSQSRDKVILLGDMNTLPALARKKKGFPDEPKANFEKDRTFDILKNIPGMSEIIPDGTYRQDEKSTFTFPADLPTRRLDYIFYGNCLELVEGRIYREAGQVSDHLPIIATFRFRGERLECSSEKKP